MSPRTGLPSRGRWLRLSKSKRIRRLWLLEWKQLAPPGSPRAHARGSPAMSHSSPCPPCPLWPFFFFFFFFFLQPTAHSPQPNPTHQPLGVLRQFGEAQMELSLGRLAAAAGDQARQAAVAGPVGRPQHDARRVDQLDLGADDQLQVQVLGRRVGPHDAGQRVAVRHRQRGQAQLGGPLGQLVGMRGPLEKREIGFAVQLGIARPARAGRRTAAGRGRFFEAGCSGMGLGGNGVKRRVIVVRFFVQLNAPCKNQRPLVNWRNSQ